MTAAYGEHVTGRGVIDALRDSLAEFRALAPRVAPERWRTPWAPGKWTIAQTMLHVAQWELIGAARVRMALVLTPCTMTPLDQDALMRVEARDVDGPRALAAFAGLREMNIALAAGLSAAERAKTCQHPERGAQTVERPVDDARRPRRAPLQADRVMPRLTPRVLSRIATVAAAVVLVASTPGAQAPPAASAPDPSSAPFVVSVWYRGGPAGVPRAKDLAAIRDLGFTAITWPVSAMKALADVTSLAKQAGLSVNVRGEYQTTGRRPSGDRPTRIERIDLAVKTMPVAELVPFAWRAIARGARELAFDSGEPVGAGLVDAKGETLPWAYAAAELARQLRINGDVLLHATPVSAITPQPPVPPAFDAVLLDAGKSWVLIATNLSRDHAIATIRLPADVPYALWLDILSGASMAMLSEPAGPRWTVDLGGWATRVYVIDKTLK